MPVRHEKMFQTLGFPPAGPGLEIGALDNPIVTKAIADVRYVDYADLTYLRDEKAHSASVRLDRLVDVDLVWSRGPLQPLLDQEKVAWVVASHVIEHVPNPIAWLRELSSVLEDGGRILLAVPDKRFTFDANRPCTSLGELVEAYLEERDQPAPRQLFDVTFDGTVVDKRKRWRRPPDDNGEPDWSRLSHAFDLAKAARAGRAYIDAHCWVFTPQRLLLCLEGMARLGLLDVVCETAHATALNEYEFFVTLRKVSAAEARAESYAAARRCILLSPTEQRIPTIERFLADDLAFYKRASAARLLQLIDTNEKRETKI